MQNLKLQVLWLYDSLGLAINQKTAEGLLPLTPYYFWPISEAWEQIRFELDSKPWVSEDERVMLLNSVVEVMTQWQNARSTTAIAEAKVTVQDNITVVGLP